MAKRNMPGPEDFERHVQNVVESASAATPSERRAGAQWYSRAHREAVHVAMGEQRGTPGYNQRVRGQVGADPEAVRRAAGSIAALSPASPAGMRWETTDKSGRRRLPNVEAAHQIKDLTPEQYHDIKSANEAVHAVTRANGSLRAAANRGLPTGQHDAMVEAAKQHAAETSARARSHLSGSLVHAGNQAIQSAYEIHHGIRAPEAVLPMHAKTGHFYGDIASPMDSKPGQPGTGTVDQHMSNVISGQRQKWGESRGGNNPEEMPSLGSPAGYAYHRDVLHEAASQLGMRVNQAQATSWIHEKNDKAPARPSPSIQRAQHRRDSSGPDSGAAGEGS